MKFGYEGAQNSEVIRNYKINEDKIIITFLDGSIHEVLLTEENENDLLNRMLQQAQERNESSELSIAIRQRRQTLLWAIYLGMVDLGFIRNIIDTTGWRRTLDTVFAGIIGLTIVMSGSFCKFKYDEIREIKKYAIYLAVRDRLEEMENPSTLLGEKGKERKLNINTLDNYSLRDLKKIRDNLEKNGTDFNPGEFVQPSHTSSKKNVFTKK